MLAWANSIRFLALALILPLAAAAQAPAPVAGSPATPARSPVETIVFIRHAEKPAGDLGQLSVQGLNRALALPDVLNAKFGRPDFIFAPLTSPRQGARRRHVFLRPPADDHRAHCHPRRPARGHALRPGRHRQPPGRTRRKNLPARDGLRGLGAFSKLDELVRRMVSAFGGNDKDVPAWPSEDFDSIFVLRLRTEPEGRKSITFEHDHEGLDGLSKDYPVLKKTL